MHCWLSISTISRIISWKINRLPVFQGGCLVVDPVVAMEILNDKSVSVNGTSLDITPDIETITTLSQVIFVGCQFALIIPITKPLHEELRITFSHLKFTVIIITLESSLHHHFITHILTVKSELKPEQ